MVSDASSSEIDKLFRRQLGERLRGLRKRAGLTQKEIARLMGRRPETTRVQIARLEAGKNPNPRLCFLLDYLRSCRAGIEEVVDVLASYTSRKPVIEEAARQVVERMTRNLPKPIADKVNRYDVKTTVAGRFDARPVEEPDKRIRRSQKFAASLLQRRRLEEVLFFTIKQLGDEGSGTKRKYLADFGRKLWGILNRTRKKDRDKQPELLSQARSKLLAENVVSETALDKVAAAVIELHRRLEMTGKLDELPAVAELQPKPERAEDRLHREWLEKLQEHQVAREAAIAKVWEEVQREAVAAGVPAGEQVLYLGLVRQTCYIVDHSAPDSTERRALVEAEASRLVARHQPAELIRRLADLAITRYSEIKPGLPPDPRPSR